jgi:hypothetical protein
LKAHVETLPPISLFSLLFYDFLSITEEKGWER